MRTFGAPSRARGGAGHAGLDSSAVRPITPGKAAPSGYSTIGIMDSLFGKAASSRTDTKSTGRTR